MAVTIGDIIKIMEAIAPARLAEKWDNAGLQVGRKDWPVKKIRVALDPLLDVVSAACHDKIDLLITHHPLLFKPLKSIDFNSPVGTVIHKAAHHQMGIFSAHTNLDSVKGGVNDVLADKIGLTNLSVLADEIRPEAYKLVIYVPAEDEHELLDALFETPAGRIGNYDCCSFRNRGMGTFRPNEAAHPFKGEKGEISHADEIRVEAVIQKEDLKTVINRIRSHHPYETMAYDISPLFDAASEADRGQGIGRIGFLSPPVSLKKFALEIKQKLNIPTIKIAGDPDMLVEKAALCSGSGASLMEIFFSSNAQVYISGDLRYHDARDVQSAGRGLIDIGHFASEHLIIESLSQKLQHILADENISVDACNLEKEPFIFL